MRTVENTRNTLFPAKGVAVVIILVLFSTGDGMHKSIHYLCITITRNISCVQVEGEITFQHHSAREYNTETTGAGFVIQRVREMFCWHTGPKTVIADNHETVRCHRVSKKGTVKDACNNRPLS